ncbi:hypothetical protein D3C86_1462430 [compost metagenome]
MPAEGGHLLGGHGLLVGLDPGDDLGVGGPRLDDLAERVGIEAVGCEEALVGAAGVGGVLAEGAGEAGAGLVDQAGKPHVAVELGVGAAGEVFGEIQGFRHGAFPFAKQDIKRREARLNWLSLTYQKEAAFVKCGFRPCHGRRWLTRCSSRPAAAWRC